MRGTRSGSHPAACRLRLLFDRYEQRIDLRAHDFQQREHRLACVFVHPSHPTFCLTKFAARRVKPPNCPTITWTSPGGIAFEANRVAATNASTATSQAVSATQPW